MSPIADLDQDVRARLFELMTGLSSLRDFQRWFASVAWELGDRDVGSHPISRRVELRLAEYTNGDWSVEDVLHELGKILRPPNSPALTGGGLGFSKREPQSFRQARWYTGTKTQAVATSDS